MKKILIAFDAAHFSEGALNFADYMNRQTPILLTGIFLPVVDYSNLWNYANAAAGPVFVPFVESDESEAIRENVDRFKAFCEEKNIEYLVHKDFFDFMLPELKKETRFADLIILGGESFFKNIGRGEPNEYLRDTLHAAECRVMVVPEEFNFPQCNILAYDGTESSVYAIKQFSYLFPELANNKTLLVTGDTDVSSAIPEEHFIRELMSSHFPNLEVQKLEIDPRVYFTSWLDERDAPLLVSGAFGRSSFSQLFKSSFVSDVIRDHKFPVFIAHHK